MEIHLIHNRLSPHCPCDCLAQCSLTNLQQGYLKHLFTLDTPLKQNDMVHFISRCVTPTSYMKPAIFPFMCPLPRKCGTCKYTAEVSI